MKIVRRGPADKHAALIQLMVWHLTAVFPKNFHGSSDICPMGFIYPLQICKNHSSDISAWPSEMSDDFRVHCNRWQTITSTYVDQDIRCILESLGHNELTVLHLLSFKVDISRDANQLTNVNENFDLDLSPKI